MRLPDCHIHTHFSSDSDANPEQVIKRAVELELPAICFTDHNDFGWFCDADGTVPFQLNFDEYVDYMRDLAERTAKSGAKNLRVLTGVEQGLGCGCASLVNEYDSEHRLDFIIGSSHLVNGKDPYDAEFWEDTDISDAITAYYQSIIDNIGVCDNFDVYGHIDYVVRYIPDKSYRYNVKDYMDMIEIILKMLIDKGKGIELNTAGLRYGLGAPNPEAAILSLYHELGGEIITVGSDAHNVKDVAFYNNQAYQYLLEAGFRYYTVFAKRKPEFFKL